MSETGRISLCRHEIPGEPVHFDLFLGPGDDVHPDERVLRTWRLPQDPAGLAVGEGLDVTRLGAHRGAYLHLEGPTVPKSAPGMVSPVRRGTCTVREVAGGRLLLRIDWGDGVEVRLELSDDRLLRSGPGGDDVEPGRR